MGGNHPCKRCYPYFGSNIHCENTPFAWTLSAGRKTVFKTSALVTTSPTSRIGPPIGFGSSRFHTRIPTTCIIFRFKKLNCCREKRNKQSRVGEPLGGGGKGGRGHGRSRPLAEVLKTRVGATSSASESSPPKAPPFFFFSESSFWHNWHGLEKCVTLAAALRARRKALHYVRRWKRAGRVHRAGGGGHEAPGGAPGAEQVRPVLPRATRRPGGGGGLGDGPVVRASDENIGRGQRRRRGRERLGNEGSRGGARRGILAGRGHRLLQRREGTAGFVLSVGGGGRGGGERGRGADDAGPSVPRRGF